MISLQMFYNFPHTPNSTTIQQHFESYYFSIWRIFCFLKKKKASNSTKNTRQCNWSDQIRSVAQSCLTLFDPMNCSTPGLPVHHQLLEFTQTHIHWVSDAIQPSHLLSPLLLLPPIPPSIRVFSNESTLRMRSLQSCPILCNPMNRNLPGFSVHGILQTRILE